MIKVTLEFTTIYAAAAALMTLQEAGHGAAIPADDKVTAAPAPAAVKVATGKQPAVAASTDTPAGAQAASAGSAQTGEAGKPDAGAQPAASSAQTAFTEKPSATPAQAASAATSMGEAISYEKDVKPVVIKVGAAGKRDALVELLKKFGVAKGPEVPADKLPAFKTELEALLA